MYKIERVPTGITGLDMHIEGGFPKNRTILVSGGPGTGKTIFAFQYLINGAMLYNEPGVALVLDENPRKLREDMLRFGWDLKKLENQGLIAIVDATAARIGTTSEERFAIHPFDLDIDKLFLEVLKVCENIGAKRLIIDSISALGFYSLKLEDIRRLIMKLSYLIEKQNLTAIITSEVDSYDVRSKFSRFGVEEYVSDGVISLYYLDVGSTSTRTLLIRKMRSTDHTEGLLPMEITEKGIVVKEREF
jgi:KaiC/GvpD/RAD55 family RecA-like ATPase